MNMDIITFSTEISGCITTFEPISRNLIPNHSMLDMLIRRSGKIIVYHDTYNEIDVFIKDNKIVNIITYLNNSNYPCLPEWTTILDYYGVDRYGSYSLIYEKEKFFRDNFYNPEFKDHEIQSMYYNLIGYSSEYFGKYLQQYRDQHSNRFIYNTNLLFKTIKPSLHTFNFSKQNFLFEIATKYDVNVFMAGGFIFNAVMNVESKSSDIDIFFVDSQPQDIILYMREIIEYCCKDHDYYVKTISTMRHYKRICKEIDSVENRLTFDEDLYERSRGDEYVYNRLLQVKINRYRELCKQRDELFKRRNKILMLYKHDIMAIDKILNEAQAHPFYIRRSKNTISFKCKGRE